MPSVSIALGSQLWILDDPKSLILVDVVHTHMAAEFLGRFFTGVLAQSMGVQHSALRIPAMQLKVTADKSGCRLWALHYWPQLVHDHNYLRVHQVCRAYTIVLKRTAASYQG